MFAYELAYFFTITKTANIRPVIFLKVGTHWLFIFPKKNSS